MTEINKSDINIYQPMGKRIQPDAKGSGNEKPQNVAKDYKEEVAAPGMEALGRAMIKRAESSDNIEKDIKKILDNPKLVEQSDILFTTAEKAGIPYPVAATFATKELG